MIASPESQNGTDAEKISSVFLKEMKQINDLEKKILKTVYPEGKQARELYDLLECDIDEFEEAIIYLENREAITDGYIVSITPFGIWLMNALDMVDKGHADERAALRALQTADPQALWPKELADILSVNFPMLRDYSTFLNVMQNLVDRGYVRDTGNCFYLTCEGEAISWSLWGKRL